MSVPALGFPRECWDVDGDYFCVPHHDVVAAVIDRGGSLAVDICTGLRGHSNLSHAWLYADRTLLEVDVDCALQAQAVIQHFIDTHPPIKEDTDGED